jgi:hypothetical protein
MTTSPGVIISRSSFFGVEHLDAHRLILEPAIGSRRRHVHRLLHGRQLLELDHDRLLLPGRDRHRGRHRREPLLDDGQRDRSRADVNPRFAAAVGQVRPVRDDDLRAGDGRAARGYRAGQPGLRGLATLNRQREPQREDDHAHECATSRHGSLGLQAPLCHDRFRPS